MQSNQTSTPTRHAQLEHSESEIDYLGDEYVQQKVNEQDVVSFLSLILIPNFIMQDDQFTMMRYSGAMEYPEDVEDSYANDPQLALEAFHLLKEQIRHQSATISHLYKRLSRREEKLKYNATGHIEYIKETTPQSYKNCFRIEETILDKPSSNDNKMKIRDEDNIFEEYLEEENENIVECTSPVEEIDAIKCNVQDETKRKKVIDPDPAKNPVIFFFNYI